MQSLRKWKQELVKKNPSFSLKLDLLSENTKLFKKLENKSHKLGDLCFVTFGLRSCAKGVGKGGKERLISQSKKSEIDKPYLEGREIKRYTINSLNRYISYLPSEMYSPRDPRLFEAKKIISQSMLSNKRLIATLDFENRYVEQSLVCIIPHGILTPKSEVSAPPLEFILGIINSKLESFYFSSVVIDYSLGGGLIHATPGSQGKLIIPKASKSDIDKMVNLVTQLIQLNSRNFDSLTPIEVEQLKRQIAATDRQIDELVYQIYGLTEDEIVLVESSN